MRTTNTNCQQYVDKCQPFTGSNLTGVKVSNKLYIVYSYGHWPIWANIKGQWYGHNSKYSQTTSCHTTRSRPSIDNNIITLKNVEELKMKIESARS